MRIQLDAFIGQRLDLSGLISTLEALRNHLEHPDPDWADRFYEEWGTLEELYSLSMDRGLPLSESQLGEVDRAVVALRSLVERALEQEPEDP